MASSLQVLRFFIAIIFRVRRWTMDIDDVPPLMLVHVLHTWPGPEICLLTRNSNHIYTVHVREQRACERESQWGGRRKIIWILSWNISCNCLVAAIFLKLKPYQRGWLRMTRKGWAKWYGCQISWKRCVNVCNTVLWNSVLIRSLNLTLTNFVPPFMYTISYWAVWVIWLVGSQSCPDFGPEKAVSFCA